MNRCYDCGNEQEKGKHFFEDPRDPPGDHGKCLCKKCFIEVAFEVINDHHEEMLRLVRSLLKAKDVE